MAHNSRYSNDFGYVDIHGRDIEVLVCDKTGRILIPIDELKEVGFRIYRKSQYNRFLVDENQFRREFDLFMLQTAQTYMLKNKIVFKENEILESINKCKKMLSQDSNSFVNSHVIEKNDDSIMITASLRDSTTHNNNQHNAHKSSSPNDKHNAGSEKSFSGKRSANDFKRNINFDMQDSFGKKEQSPNSSFELRKPKSFNPSSVVADGGQKNLNANSNGMQDGRSRNFNSNLVSHNTNRQDNRPTNNGQDNRQKTIFSNGNQTELPRLETAKLTKPEHTVLITHVDPTCDFVWAQDTDNVDTLLEIDSKIKEESGKPNVTSRLMLNKVYLAEDEGLWYRCKVIKFKPVKVFFLDFGNVAETTEVKEASEDLAKIPCQALKLKFEGQYKPTEFETITIAVKSSTETGTYFVSVKDQVEPNVPKSPPASKTPAASKTPPVSKTPPASSTPPVSSTPTFFKKPEPLCDLVHGQRVMIISQADKKLALRTKECYDKLKQIEKELESVTTKPVTSVKKDQVVLCKTGLMQRGIVTNIQMGKLEVELLDYYEKVTVDLSSLYHIPESLAKEPVTYLITPSLKGFTDESAKVIQELISSRAKSTVVLNGGDFDLQLGKELLSDKIKPQDSHAGRVMLKDMTLFKPKLGVGQYVLNTFTSVDDLTLASSEAFEDYVQSIFKTEMEDSEPYEPVVGEVCFGYYQDSWSRCTVVNVTNSSYKVRFIDFGNLECLKKDQLRKLTDDVKDTPVLDFPCKLIGLSVENIDELLKQHLVTSDCYDVNVKNHAGEVYEVEIPALKDLI